MSEVTNKLNFIFWGTPDVAKETLDILKSAGYTPALIVTSPDARSGRKMLLTPPPVKVWAEENHIPCIQPETLKDLAIPGDFDLSIVVAYGKIMPENLINLPRLGSINIHYSLLPKYRGASPVESAVLNGDTTTGVTIQQMEYKMDAGAVLAQQEVSIGNDEKAPDLRKRLINIGGDLLVKILPDIINKKITPKQQEETLATHCKKINKEDGLLDLSEDPVQNYNKFRAYANWPRTFFFKEDKRVIITEAKLENNTFIIEKVIPEGGKETIYKG